MVQTLSRVLFLFLLIPSVTYANDPSLQWKTLETPHFNIHFDNNLRETAVKTGQLAEAIHLKLVKKINWTPQDKTDLILTDATDFSNGSATPFPKNRSTLIIKPAITTSFDYYSWLETLIVHEYTHILHLDKASGAPKVLRNIIGRFPLLFPNILEPTWFIEGLATYIETDHQRKIGRGQNSHFQMMMRMEVDRGLKPISKVNIRNTDWPLNQVYLYGEHFYRFIANQYGTEKVNEISDEYGDDIMPFFINRNAEIVLGKDLTQLWDEFTIYWNQHYLKKINSIKSNPLVRGKQITSDRFFTHEFESTPEGLYYIRKNPFEEVMLMFKGNDGITKEILPINSTAKLNWHPTAGLLIAQPEICDTFNTYFDLYQLKDGRSQATKLTDCSRYSEAKWSKDGTSIIALKSDKSIVSLDKISASGEFVSNLWQGKQEQVISQFDLSADDRFVIAAIKEPDSSRFQLSEFEIAKNSWKVLTGNSVNHVFPQYSRDNTQIIFSADYNSVYNLYKINRDTKAINRFTNVVGGVFQVKEKYSAGQSESGHSENNHSENNHFYYAGYTANGYDIYELESQDSLQTLNLSLPKVDKKEVSNILAKSIDKTEGTITDYSPWSSLTPAYWLPFSSGNEDEVEVGITTSGSDALGIHHYFASVGVNIDKNISFGGFGYAYSRYLNMRVNRSIEFGAEVNGISSYLTEDEFEIGFHLPLFKIKSQWDIFAGVASTNIEQGFYSDENFSPSSKFSDGIVAFGISFNNSQSFFKSNANSDGRQISLLAESSDLLSSNFSGKTYTLDWREFIQIKNEHSLAFRFVKGWSTGNANPFRLGGEDSDIFVINRAELNKRSYALRGYSEGLIQLRGRRMQMANIEYRFPIARVEKTMMAPPVGLGAISGKIFYDYGTAFQETTKEYFSSAGIELHTTLQLFYNVPLDLRLGYAEGFDIGGEKRSYFSIGKSF